jgi:hypothetical protein
MNLNGDYVFPTSKFHEILALILYSTGFQVTELQLSATKLLMPSFMTNCLTPRSSAKLKKLLVAQLVNKFSAVCRLGRFNALSATARH